MFIQILITVFMWSAIISFIGVVASASCFHNLPSKVENAILAAMTVALASGFILIICGVVHMTISLWS